MLFGALLSLTCREIETEERREMIEQRLQAGLVARPPHPNLPDSVAASAALLARLARPPFPFPPVSQAHNPFLGGKLPPGVPPMLAHLPHIPDIRARLLGLQFPPRPDTLPRPQFSPPTPFLGAFNFNRDGSDSPIDGELS